MGNNKNAKTSWKRSQRDKFPVPIIIIALLVVLLTFVVDFSGFLSKSPRNTQSLDLKFSAVQPDNKTTLTASNGRYYDWFRVRNYGSQDISLGGINVLRNTDVKQVFIFPDISIQPDEEVTVFCKTKVPLDCDDLFAPFSLSSAGNQTLLLIDTRNNELDRVELPELPKNSIYTRSEGDTWTVIENSVDASSSIKANESLVPDTASESVSQVMISEVMSTNPIYARSSNGELYDYIELHNTGSSPSSLNGLYLSIDNSDKKCALPDMVVPGDGYVIIYASGLSDNMPSGEVHISLKLPKAGCELTLSSANTPVQTVSIPELQTGESYSFANGSWTTSLPPTPGLSNDNNSANTIQKSIVSSANTGIIISEFMASPTDENCDWLELYNGGSEAVDLGGYGLSDDINKPRAWQFPAGTIINPGEYKLILLVGASGTPYPGYICAPFAISSAGGNTVCLADPSGTVLDLIYTPEQYPGISYGRSADGNTGYLSVSTMQGPNTGSGMNGRASAATYSVQGGLYSSGTALSVSLTSEPGSRIYYTTDCSDPTESSSLYTGTPISVSSTTILRTRVFKDNCLPSLMNTQSYLYDIPNANDVRYVISLVSDPVGLFSDESGIMVKGPHAEASFPYGDKGRGANFWMDWERESHIELFTANETAISQECGIAIRGRNTRAYELKGFKVKAREKYGSDRFNYPVFSKRDYTDYDALILRYTGQDYKYAFMRDPVLMSLARDTNVMYMESEICVMYLNGEYYSAMYLRESLDSYAICRHNNWPVSEKDTLDIVKSGVSVLKGSNDSYLELRSWLGEHDPNTDEAYEYIDNHVDLDSFIDYICLIAYTATPDTVNVKRYRNPNYDGKWRWALYDVDRGLRENIDPFTLLSGGTNAVLFNACMKNERIRERLFVRLNELLSTTFSSANVVPKIEQQYELLEPIMPNYLKMFNIKPSEWSSNVRSLKRNVIKRPTQVIKHAVDYFSLTEDQMYKYFGDAIETIKAYQQ